MEFKTLKGLGTYKVNANYTKEMADDIAKQSGYDSSMEDIFIEALKRQKIYNRRKEIVDKLLKEI